MVCVLDSVPAPLVYPCVNATAPSPRPEKIVGAVSAQVFSTFLFQERNILAINPLNMVDQPVA